MNDKFDSFCFGIFAGFTITLLLSSLVTAPIHKNHQKIMREAVEKGYAEWYSQEPSNRPTEWRWK